VGAALTSVFLSYARADDEPFVLLLYQRLNAAGFSVWWDRITMPSRGLTFLHEIRAAINASDRFVAVLGPAAAGSEYVRAEWQHALAEGKPITPVLRQGGEELVPAELKPLHYIDCRDTRDNDAALTKLMRALADPIPPLGLLSEDIPPSPPHFQPRPDDLARLAEIILAEDRRPVSITDPERTTILHGMPGLGKTVLAASFARSTSTRRVFPGGIYWVTGREETTAVGLTNSLRAQLSDPFPATLEIAESTSRLRGLLSGKRALIVVDNAWHVEQLEPITAALDSQTRLLVTSRNAALVTSLGAGEFRLGLFGEGAALRLLADWTDESPDALPLEARDLIRECGYLPLALSLNGAMAADGNTWADLVEALREADLTFAEKDLGRFTYPTVFRSLKISVEALYREDSVAAERYRELAAFLGEQPIPEEAVLTLWRHQAKLDDRYARRLLVRLEGKSLVQLEGAPPYRRIRLHNLVHDFLRATLDDSAALNAALLAAYRERCSDDWPSGPDDGYFYQHLIEHLLAADDHDEVHRVLALETPEGGSAWHQAHDRIGNWDGYLADVHLAWRDASSMTIQVGGESRRRSIGLECRYALIAASMNGLATRMPSQLIALVLAANDPRWTPVSMLDRIRHHTDPNDAAECIAALGPYLSLELLPRAISIARGIEEGDGQARALASLALVAARLSEPRLAVETAEQIEDEGVRAQALVELAPIAETLSAVARAELLEAAVAAVQHMGFGPLRVWALAELVSMAAALPNPARSRVQQAAIQAAEAADEGAARASLLVAVVAAGLPQPERAVLLNEALEAAGRIDDMRLRAEAFLEVAAQLPKSRRKGALEAALEAAGRIDDMRLRAEAFLEVAAQLPKSRRKGALEAALEAAGRVPETGQRAVALAVVAAELPEGQRAKVAHVALEAARRAGDGRESALVSVAALLSHDQRGEVLQEAVSSAERKEFDSWRSQALRELVAAAGPLSDDWKAWVLQATLEATGRIHDSYWRAVTMETLVPLAAQLAEPLQTEILQTALETAGRIDERIFRARALAAVAFELPEGRRAPVVRTALASAERIADEPWQVEALLALATELPVGERGTVLQAAVAAAERINESSLRSSAFGAVAANSSDDSLLMEAVERVANPDERMDILLTAAAGLTDERRLSFLERALKTADRIEDKFSRGLHLREVFTMAAELGDDRGLMIRHAARTGIERIDGPKTFTREMELTRGMRTGEWTYSKNAEKSFGEKLAEELEHVDDFSQSGFPSWITSIEEAVVASVPNAVPRAEAMQIAMRASPWLTVNVSHARVLAAVAAQLPGKWRTEAVLAALAALGRIDDGYTRARALAALLPLAPHITGPLLEDVVKAAREEAEHSIPSVRGRALVMVAASIPIERRSEVLYSALRVANDESQYSQSQAKIVRELSPVVTGLPDEARASVLQVALATANAIDDDFWRAKALTAVACQLPKSQSAAVLHSVLEAVERMTVETSRGEDWMALRPTPVLESSRADVLAEVAASLQGVSVDHLPRLWEHLLHDLALCTRSTLLLALAQLAPLIASYAPPSGPAEVGCAVTEVCRYFP
jgi:hypothetical protein